MGGGGFLGVDLAAGWRAGGTMNAAMTDGGGDCMACRIRGAATDDLRTRPRACIA